MIEKRCLIIGAGLAGLMAANRLQQYGWQVVVLEQASLAGGRLSTQQIALAGGRVATFDAGAQFFTVRSPRFRELVADWLAAGVVVEWSRGFAAADGSYYNDGHPRYRGAAGMVTLAEYLAGALDVRLGSQALAVHREHRCWSAGLDGQATLSAPALIMALPAAQALALLRNGGSAIPANVERTLAELTFDPCLAMLIALDGPSAVPAPGGMWPGDETISWLADNQQKGISASPAVTIHASPEFSREYLTADEAAIAERLITAAAPYVGSVTLDWRLERWAYSIPRVVYPQSCLYAPGLPPLLFAGDAFAGPRVEGAALSGLAAADVLLASSLS
jgi:predicted NAD/FAD-dependent oxidoreductase